MTTMPTEATTPAAKLATTTPAVTVTGYCWYDHAGRLLATFGTCLMPFADRCRLAERAAAALELVDGYTAAEVREFGRGGLLNMVEAGGDGYTDEHDAVVVESAGAPPPPVCADILVDLSGLDGSD